MQYTAYTYTYSSLTHTQYGMMFFLKHKDEQFDAFKTYKAWAERQTGWKLKQSITIEAVSSCQRSKNTVKLE